MTRLKPILRVVLALEFLAALVTWSLGVLPWQLAWAVAVSTLIGLLTSEREDLHWRPCSDDEPPTLRSAER